MNSIRILLLILVAVLHWYFMYLEMFLWTKPKGLKIFSQSLEKAMSSKVLAANQGLYNGFLSVGLIWAAVSTDSSMSLQLGIFFFACVFIAGAYGGFSVNRRIFFIQGLPALLGLLVSFFQI